MKMRVSIEREYDTESDDHGHLFDGVSDPMVLALHYFAEDIEKLVSANAVIESATGKLVESDSV